MHYKETSFGFEYGPVRVDRLFSDEKNGWVALGIGTDKYPHHGIRVYVTKTGKVRIHDNDGEWVRPAKLIGRVA